jgi:putative transposase
MARPPRYQLSGLPQHVVHRGSPGRLLFNGDPDYRFFLDSLAANCRRYQCALHAYVLMPDHVRLLLTPDIPDGVARLMQATGRQWSHHYKQSIHQAGHPWAGRYKSTVIEAQTWLLACYCYIEQTPVHAGFVTTPGEYPWSSYTAHALDQQDLVILDHPVYTALAADKQARCMAYRKHCLLPMDAATRRFIDDATRAGWALGSEQFQKDIEQSIHRRVRPLPRGGYRRRTPE